MDEDLWIAAILFCTTKLSLSSKGRGLIVTCNFVKIGHCAFVSGSSQLNVKAPWWIFFNGYFFNFT